MAGLDVVDWSDEPTHFHEFDDCESARTFDPFEDVPSRVCGPDAGAGPVATPTADTSHEAILALDSAAPTGCVFPLGADANHDGELQLHEDHALLSAAPGHCVRLYTEAQVAAAINAAADAYLAASDHPHKSAVATEPQVNHDILTAAATSETSELEAALSKPAKLQDVEVQTEEPDMQAVPDVTIVCMTCSKRTAVYIPMHAAADATVNDAPTYDGRVDPYRDNIARVTEPLQVTALATAANDDLPVDERGLFFWGHHHQ